MTSALWALGTRCCTTIAKFVSFSKRCAQMAVTSMHACAVNRSLECDFTPALVLQMLLILGGQAFKSWVLTLLNPRTACSKCQSFKWSSVWLNQFHGLPLASQTSKSRWCLQRITSNHTQLHQLKVFLHGDLNLVIVVKCKLDCCFCNSRVCFQWESKGICNCPTLFAGHWTLHSIHSNALSHCKVHDDIRWTELCQFLFQLLCTITVVEAECQVLLLQHWKAAIKQHSWIVEQNNHPTRAGDPRALKVKWVT